MQWGEKLFKPENLPKETTHKAIISKQLFQSVQNILYNKSRPRKQKHNHAYTGLFQCSECGGMITAELQKGVVYYRCTKKKKGFNIKCSQPYIREDVLEEEMEKAIQNHFIPADFIKWALEKLNKNNDIEDQKARAILTQQRKQISQLEIQLSQLLKMKISPSNINNDLLSDEEYLVQKNAILKEKDIMQERLLDIEKNISNWLERCEEFFDFAVDIENKWRCGTPEEKKFVFSVIFGSNSLLMNKKLNIEAKKPFFRRALLEDSLHWRTGRDSNSRPSP
ncbi:MAG: hypothetical protein EOM19_04630 [Candidatus Moranbacteria bacterium]|nr:hypothetical protein [Candidatus Moranbacteria bacterium]